MLPNSVPLRLDGCVVRDQLNFTHDFILRSVYVLAGHFLNYQLVQLTDSIPLCPIVFFFCILSFCLYLREEIASSAKVFFLDIMRPLSTCSRLTFHPYSGMYQIWCLLLRKKMNTLYVSGRIHHSKSHKKQFIHAHFLFQALYNAETWLFPFKFA